MGWEAAAVRFVRDSRVPATGCCPQKELVRCCWWPGGHPARLGAGDRPSHLAPSTTGSRRHCWNPPAAL